MSNLRRSVWCALFVCVSVSTGGCARVDEPEAGVTTVVRVTGATAGIADGGSSYPGYVHVLSQSRFRIGHGAALETSAPALLRWRGSLGAFALDPTNGYTTAVLDNTSPRGPYIVDSATQAPMVQAYFVNAGLPSDQVGGVGAYYEVGGGGAMTAGLVSQPIQVTSINSSLSRAIRGVRVVESFAWAKMTTSGDVDMESVFWPPIDAGVVDAAVAFKAQMADPVAHGTYLQSLGGVVYRDDGVVIHHTNGGSIQHLWRTCRTMS